MTRALWSLALVLLVACSPRGQITYSPEAAKVGQVTPVFIGTTRVLAEGAFGQERSEEMRFARFDVSIPPQRTRGDINWPTRFEKPNPARHFLTTKEVLYPSNPDFRADLQRNLAANGYEAVIFVHGYNNNFAEGVYRVAQF